MNRSQVKTATVTNDSSKGTATSYFFFQFQAISPFELEYNVTSHYFIYLLLFTTWLYNFKTNSSVSFSYFEF